MIRVPLWLYTLVAILAGALAYSAKGWGWVALCAAVYLIGHIAVQRR